jgi:hypothetical protein
LLSQERRAREKNAPNLLSSFPPVSCWGPHWLNPTGSQRTKEPIYESLWVSREEGAEQGEQRQRVGVKGKYKAPWSLASVTPHPDHFPTCERGKESFWGPRGLRQPSVFLFLCVLGGEGVMWGRRGTHWYHSHPHPSPSQHLISLWQSGSTHG